MAHFHDDEEDYIGERDKLVAYMLAFAIKSFQIIQNHDSDALYELCMRCAEEIYAYRNDVELPDDPGGSRKPKNGGWRLV